MANTWTSFTNLPSGFQPDTMILLTDGSVLVHNPYGKDWRRLTPDSQGKYESGTWSGALNMTNTRQFIASAHGMRNVYDFPSSSLRARWPHRNG